MLVLNVSKQGAFIEVFQSQQNLAFFEMFWHISDTIFSVTYINLESVVELSNQLILWVRRRLKFKLKMFSMGS